MPVVKNVSIDILMVAVLMQRDEQITDPPQGVIRETKRICDNIALQEIEQTYSDVVALLTGRENYIDWFIHYVIIRRISREPDNHDLYIQLMDFMDTDEVFRITVRAIKALLRFKKNDPRDDNLSILRNFGNWLGILTIRRDKPIHCEDLDIKEILLEAIKKGYRQQNYVLPFVIEVMKNCFTSKVFRPPHPWAMSIVPILERVCAEKL